MDLGVHINGASLGPKSVFDCLDYDNKILIEQNSSYIKETSKDIKNKNEKELRKFLEEFSIVYKEIIDNNEFPILIGGDHSASITSTLCSNQNQGPLGVIWFDAHTDYHIHSSTISGNLHGTPLAAINGKDILWTDVQKNNFVNEENTVIFGARSIDEKEYNNLDSSKVTLITPEEISAIGFENSLTKAFEIANKNTSGIHISLDLDFLDPKIAPGVSTPVNDGCDINGFNIVLKSIIENMVYIKSFDIMEFNPVFDNDNQTLNIILDILYKLFSIK